MKWWLRSGVVAIALLLAIPAIALIGRVTGSRASTDWTALRFEHPDLATTGLTPGVDNNVAFVIDRHGDQQSYRWTAEMQTGSASHTISSGNTVVPAGGSGTLEVSVPSSLAEPGSRLFIALDTGQRIDLRVAGERA